MACFRAVEQYRILFESVGDFLIVEFPRTKRGFAKRMSLDDSKAFCHLLARCYMLHLREQRKRRVALFTALKLSRRYLIVHLNNQFTTGHNRNHELASLRQPSHRNCANHKYYGAFRIKATELYSLSLRSQLCFFSFSLIAPRAPNTSRFSTRAWSWTRFG